MNVVELTKELISIPSESRDSNRAVSDFISSVLADLGFVIEEVTYDDEGAEKVSLVAKRGTGTGGLAFLSHSDTVPGGEGWEPFKPSLKDGRLYGRGSCDMKGALAASVIAASTLGEDELEHPVWVIVASDEEAGLKGAQCVVADSAMFRESPPQFGIVCEATGLVPVYAHKGVVNIQVTAHGVSAHSSAGQGDSSNFKIAPFLASVVELKRLFDADQRFQNPQFDPPTNGLNMVINDGDTAPNVTAARTDCRINFRVMPDASADEVLDMITSRARTHDLDVKVRLNLDPFRGERDGKLARVACRTTGAPAAVTVPYGTEAFIYQHHLDAIVLGPGNIDQAHTIGEYIDLGQLESSVEVYRALTREFCAD
jgi:acetylornithine deacetylase